MLFSRAAAPGARPRIATARRRWFACGICRRSSTYLDEPRIGDILARHRDASRPRSSPSSRRSGHPHDSRPAARRAPCPGIPGLPRGRQTRAAPISRSRQPDAPPPARSAVLRDLRRNRGCPRRVAGLAGRRVREWAGKISDVLPLCRDHVWQARGVAGPALAPALAAVVLARGRAAPRLRRRRGVGLSGIAAPARSARQRAFGAAASTERAAPPWHRWAAAASARSAPAPARPASARCRWSRRWSKAPTGAARSRAAMVCASAMRHARWRCRTLRLSARSRRGPPMPGWRCCAGSWRSRCGAALGRPGRSGAASNRQLGSGPARVSPAPYSAEPVDGTASATHLSEEIVGMEFPVTARWADDSYRESRRECVRNPPPGGFFVAWRGLGEGFGLVLSLDSDRQRDRRRAAVRVFRADRGADRRDISVGDPGRQRFAVPGSSASSSR